MPKGMKNLSSEKKAPEIFGLFGAWLFLFL